jgi:hypothetical protein
MMDKELTSTDVQAGKKATTVFVTYYTNTNLSYIEVHGTSWSTDEEGRLSIFNGNYVVMEFNTGIWIMVQLLTKQ